MTGKQKRALACLLTAPTVQEAAAKAKISYATLRRWISSDAEFQKEYMNQLQQIVADAAVEARHGMGEAVAALRSIMADTDAPPGVRVSAARTILESGTTLIELADVERRIEQLEEIMEADK